MIAAVSQDGVLGVDGKIPWIGKYPSDLKRFKRLTSGASVVMGSKTYQSIGKPLPNRHNYVVSSQPHLYPEVSVVNRPFTAVRESFYVHPTSNVWIIGGASIYLQSMGIADYIDLTIIPETINPYHTHDIARFPWINPCQFRIVRSDPGEDGLLHLLYQKY
jgi:dihydrofolate reductase